MGRIADTISRLIGKTPPLKGKRAIISLLLCLILLLSGALAGNHGVNSGGPGRIDAGGESGGGGVNAGNIRNTLLRVQRFGNRTTFEKQWETARWLEQELRKSGVGAGITTYPYKGRAWPNVIATIKGDRYPDRIVAAIAHLDSVSCQTDGNGAPGADDNGSGMAAVLELARLLHGPPMERTVMFCIFGNEEHGQQGSSAFAREARQRGKDFRAVINLDVLGYGRPRWPFYLDAVLDNNSYDQKLKMTWMMAKNYCRGVINGNNAIKVVGRPANARLVNLTSRELARISGIDVKGIVKKDCG